MADVGTGIFAWLTNAEAVTADLGSRLYPGRKVPQNVQRPYGCYQVISDPRPQHLKGYDSTRVARVQIDIFADRYADAKRVAETIIAEVATPGTHGGVKFGRVKAEGPRDLGEDADTESGFVHRASIDLLAEHKII